MKQLSPHDMNDLPAMLFWFIKEVSQPLKENLAE